MHQLEWEIREALRRHKVQTHYGATADRRRRRYAVFSDGKQANEPTSHAAAQVLREDLIVADIMALMPVALA